jgi:hypothetical protein
VKKIVLLFLFQVFCVAGFSENLLFTESFATHIPARADLDVRWNATTNGLPPKMWVYRLLPNKFSPEIISNLMALCAFTDKDETENGANAMRFKSADNSRHLDIFFPLGTIVYEAEFHYSQTNLAKDVPQMSQMPELTTNFLEKVGISPSDIEKNMNGAPNYNFWEPMEWYFVNHTFITNIEFRAASLKRSVDGASFSGAGTGGDCRIHFGEYGKITQIDLSWRNLARSKAYPTITPEMMMKCIRRGKAVHGDIPMNIADIDWPTIKSVTIKKAKPCYYAGETSAPSDWLYPFAALWATVDTGHGSIDLEIDCPIIDETNH